MASHQEQLSKAIISVGYRADKHPVIVEANEFMSLEQYLALVVIPEINELAQEYQDWERANDLAHEKTPLPKSLLMELYDVLVTLGNALDRIAPQFSVEAMQSRVNGQFHGDFTSMQEQVLNLGVGNIERNLESIFTILLSMLKHLDIDLQTEIYVRLINSKLEGNKPSKFYQKKPGMNVVDVLAKYKHVTTALRNLRRFLRTKTGLEVTLEPWLIKPFEEKILNWPKSGAMLAELTLDFANFQSQIRDEVAWHLTAGQGKKKQLPDKKPFAVRRPTDFNDLELILRLAGGVSIEAPESDGDPALQNNPSSATLGGTIFWAN